MRHKLSLPSPSASVSLFLARSSLVLFSSRESEMEAKREINSLGGSETKKTRDFVCRVHVVRYFITRFFSLHSSRPLDADDFDAKKYPLTICFVSSCVVDSLAQGVNAYRLWISCNICCLCALAV